MWNNGFLTAGTYGLINLITFADNFTILATTYEALQIMLDDITERLMKVGMTWKVKKDRKGNYVRPDAIPSGLLRSVKARKEVTIETEVGRLEVNIVENWKPWVS